ncbi:MAG TPA: hypothetical protein VL285_01555 [Bryobacteraceae bacterium]|jgi:hypothetical protein|nr:hypothetical protein [Bryobacteraceae bacterium]
MNKTAIALLAVLFLLVVSCARKGNDGIDTEVTTLGDTEVTAQLVEIPGPFPANDLYNYAYVLKYHVLQTHRGKVQGDEILVAQYNPLKPRSGAQDELSGKVGGKLETFRAGDIHRMALASPVDQFWMGGIVDKYFETKGVRYWAIWTNPASR